MNKEWMYNAFRYSVISNHDRKFDDGHEKELAYINRIKSHTFNNLE